MPRILRVVERRARSEGFADPICLPGSRMVDDPGHPQIDAISALRQTVAVSVARTAAPDTRGAAGSSDRLPGNPVTSSVVHEGRPWDGRGMGY